MKSAGLMKHNLATRLRSVSGEPELNYDPQTGAVKAPWLAWGPYLWTDGLGPDGIEGGQPGRSGGLEWTCSTEDLDGDGFPDGDVNTDGTHPAIKGRIKVAHLLLDFFKSDTTARIWYLEMGTPTRVEEVAQVVPDAFGLFQNYPNPFNPTTTIRFSLPKRKRVTLKVFDVLGREVATLFDAELHSGEHSVRFDARGLASGVYFFRLSQGDRRLVKKAVLMR